MESAMHPEIATAEPPSSWPEAPEYISIATLVEIETCPRRWALKRASYPTIWEHRGYPPRLHTGALMGTVVHRTLETIIRELSRANSPSVGDAVTIQVLRKLGRLHEDPEQLYRQGHGSPSRKSARAT